MVQIILAIAMMLEVFRKEHFDSWTGKAVTTLPRMVGFLAAAYVVVGVFTSMASVEPCRNAMAFSTGELVPAPGEDSPYKLRVVYVQRSWWGMKVDGRWTARPTGLDGWRYLHDSEGWKNVPHTVFEDAEDAVYGADNRGYYPIE